MRLLILLIEYEIRGGTKNEQSNITRTIARNVRRTFKATLTNNSRIGEMLD